MQGSGLGGRGQGAGQIQSHELLKGALRPLDRAPLAISWLGFVLSYDTEAKIAYLFYLSIYIVKLYRG